MRSERKRFIFVAVLAALVLLLMAGTVFAQPVITTFKPNEETANVGEEVTWTATSHNAESYAFYVYKRGDGDDPDQRVHTQWYSADNEVTYRFLEEGRYGARVFALDEDGKLTIVDSPLALDVKVSGDASLILTELEFVRTPPIWDPPEREETLPVGDDLMYAVKPDGGEKDFTYAYYIYFKGDGDADFKRVHLQWYEPGIPDPEYQGDPYEHNFFEYNAKEPGEYYAQAFVMDGTSKIVNVESGITKVEGASVALGITGVDVAEDEGTITWTVHATGEGDLEYAFYVQKHEEGDDWKRVDLQWYSTDKTCAYRPLESGNYRVRVFVLEPDTGKTVNDFYGEVSFEDGEALAVQLGLWDSDNDKYFEEEHYGEVGVEKTWKATVSGGAGDCEYAFYVYEGDENKVGNRVHMEWYSDSDTVDYTPKDAEAYYWVKVFVIDDAGTLLVKDSDHIKFGGTTVAPFGIDKVELIQHSLYDFEEPWVWEVKLNENHESQDDTISYCYYLYRDGDRIETQWYEEEEDTFTYDPRSDNKPFYAGEYELRAFAMDEHGHIDNEYSEPQETKLYHFNYIFGQFEGLSGGYEEYNDDLGNKNHGWVYDKGYFLEKHNAVLEDEDGSLLEYAKDVTGKTHDMSRFPAHDRLSTRSYGNQTGARDDDRPYALNVGGNAARTYYRGDGGTLYFGTMKPDGYDPFGDGSTIGPSNGMGCVWAGETLEEGGFGLYRFAGLRPQVASGRNYYPKQEFWTYMIAPNLPYGEVQFKNIHSTDCEYDGTQEARFNFEFMHHSTGYGSSVVGGDPYDQRIGISISENGTVRVLDSKAGLGKFNDARDNFYMPVLKDEADNPIDATSELYGGFDNNEWNTLRIQCLVNGRIQFLLNDKVVYTTPLGYYHVTNAERGTITLEVVQAAKTSDHALDIYKDEEDPEPILIDSTTVGNAWVELKDYSFGIMRLDRRDDYPGDWK